MDKKLSTAVIIMLIIPAFEAEVKGSLGLLVSLLAKWASFKFRERPCLKNN